MLGRIQIGSHYYDVGVFEGGHGSSLDRINVYLALPKNLEVHGRGCTRQCRGGRVVQLVYRGDDSEVVEWESPHLAGKR